MSFNRSQMATCDGFSGMRASSSSSSHRALVIGTSSETSTRFATDDMLRFFLGASVSRAASRRDGLRGAT